MTYISGDQASITGINVKITTTNNPHQTSLDVSFSWRRNTNFIIGNCPFFKLNCESGHRWQYESHEWFWFVDVCFHSLSTLIYHKTLTFFLLYLWIWAMHSKLRRLGTMNQIVDDSNLESNKFGWRLWYQSDSKSTILISM